MTTQFPVNDAAANTSLASVVTNQGADGTGITAPAGGSGARGWLSGIYKAITGTLSVTQSVGGSVVSATNPVPIYDGYAAPVSATWTTATGANTAETVSTAGMDTVIVTLVANSSVTGGAVIFEVFDGVTWLPVKAPTIIDYTTVGTVGLSASYSKGFQVPVAGFPQFRVRLSTVLSGAGASLLVTSIVSSAPDVSLVTVGIDPSTLPLPVLTTPAVASGQGALTAVSSASIAGVKLPSMPSTALGVRFYLNPSDSVTFTIAGSQPAQIGPSPNNLTMGNSNYDSTTAKFGNALPATNYGSTASAAVVGAINSNTYTMEGWVKLSSASNIMVAFGANGGNFIGVTAAGLPYAGFSTVGHLGDTYLTGSTAITDGNWHWMALVVTPTGATLLVDNAVAATSSTATVTGNASLFGAGPYGYSGTVFNWTGEVDEVAIWNYAKYSGATTPPTSAYASGLAGCVALYHFDGNGLDSSLTASAPAPEFTISGSVTGPNWDELLSLGQQVYVASYSGAPTYRFM